VLHDSAQYRWWLASALFVVLMLSSGFGFYNLSVYMAVLSNARGFAISEVSGAVSVFFLTGGVVGLVVGRLLERRDVRHVLAFGALIGGAALAAIGFVKSVWQLYLLYACFGAGNTCVSLIPATTLLTRWFDERSRPIALSFASTGLSVGGAALTPASVALFEVLPLERAMPLFGLVYAVGIGAITYAFVRGWPPGTSARSATRDASSGAAYRDVRGSRFFLLLTAAYVLLMGGQVGGIAHLFPHGAAITNPLDASIAVSALAVSSVIGRLVGGWLVTFLPYMPFTIVNLAGQAAGLFAISVASTTGVLWGGAVLFGVTVGNLLMLQPLILAQSYGVRDYSRIYGTSQAATTVGVASGPALIGLLYEHGGYSFAFGAVATLSIVALVLLWAAGAMPKSIPSNGRYSDAGGGAETAAR
jgi:MFS family permease